jgi:hypothetical protein
MIEATATINPNERYNFDPDGERFGHGIAIGIAANRSNMRGENLITDETNPYLFDSTYGDANIISRSIRNYSFRAWGEVVQ